MRDFPFTPGFARTVDPAAEADMLTEICKAATLAAVPVRDFAVLVALARRGAGELAALPDDMMMSDAVRVLERYVTL